MTCPNLKKNNLKNDGLSSFAVNQEIPVDNISKELVVSVSISEETRIFLRPVGTRSGIVYRLCKVYKDIFDHFSPFQLILSKINTLTNKLAKFLVPILKSLTTNEYAAKDSYAFARETMEQNSEFPMASLDVDFLFTNIAHEETINFCANVHVRVRISG